MRERLKLLSGPFVLCTVLLYAGVVAFYVSSRNATKPLPLKKPLIEVSSVMGDQVGRNNPIDPEIVKTANATDYVNRSYTSADRAANVYIAYYGAPSAGVPHLPNICYSVIGWKEAKQMEVDIPVSCDLPEESFLSAEVMAQEGADIPIEEGVKIKAYNLLFERGNDELAVQHWYIDTGRLVRRSGSQAYYVLSQLSLKPRYVIQVQIASEVGTSADETFENCSELSRAVWQELKAHLPETSETEGNSQ